MPATVAPTSASPPPATPPEPALTVASPLMTAISVPIPVAVAAVAIPVAVPSVPKRALLIVVMVVPSAGGPFVVVLSLDLHRGLFQVLLPLGVGALLAVPAVGAEAGQEVGTQLLAHVLLGAAWAQGTEALVVVWARRQLALGVDVEVEALVAVAAEPVAQEEVALGHLAQVELVEELARLALLAQTAQPVLADQRIEGMAAAAFVLGAAGRGDVSLGAAGAHGTVAVAVCLTYGTVGWEAVEIGLLEEGGEREGGRLLGRGRRLG